MRTHLVIITMLLMVACDNELVETNPQEMSKNGTDTEEPVTDSSAVDLIQIEVITDENILEDTIYVTF